MKFLHNLDYLLHINKMSRAELARKIEIAPSTINAWYTKDYNRRTSLRASARLYLFSRNVSSNITAYQYRIVIKY